VNTEVKCVRTWTMRGVNRMSCEETAALRPYWAMIGQSRDGESRDGEDQKKGEGQGW
jgi:hypothetical protein